MKGNIVMYNSKKTKLYSKSLIYIIFVLCMFVAFLNIYEFAFTIVGFLTVVDIAVMFIPIFFTDDIFNPLAFYGINFSVRILHFVVKDINCEPLFFTPMANKENSTIAALLIILIWNVFLILGFWLSLKRINKKVNFNYESNEFRGLLPQIKNLYICGISIFLFSLIIFYHTFSTHGGLMGMIGMMSKRTDVYSGYTKQSIGLCAIGILFVLSSQRKKLSIIMLAIGTFMVMLLGGRGSALFGIVLPFILYWNYFVKKMKIKTVVSICLAGIIVFLAVGTIRTTGELKFKISNTSVVDMIREVSEDRRLADTLPSLIYKLEDGSIDYLKGSTLVNIFFAPIPRAIWPEKPGVDDSGIVGKAILGTDYFGLPPGPFGIAFFNFGWIGVIVLAFITGYFTHKLYYKLLIVNTKRNKARYIDVIYYLLIYNLATSMISTSAQIDIVWNAGVLVVISFLDRFIQLFSYRK